MAEGCQWIGGVKSDVEKGNYGVLWLPWLFVLTGILRDMLLLICVCHLYAPTPLLRLRFQLFVAESCSLKLSHLG